MLPLKDDIPTRRFPVLTVSIIAICCVVWFLVEQSVWDLSRVGHERVLELGAIPIEVTQFEDQPQSGGLPWWLTPFTSMFTHGSLLHLAGNMLFLWIFGNNIEDSMGRFRFLAFYLLGGLVALALQVVTDTDSTIPTVGASGAIAAVLGGYALLYPRARITTVVFIVIIFTIIQLPALLVLGFWLALQLLPAFSEPIGQGGGGVAYFAHIGGFLFGLATVRLVVKRPPLRPTW